MANIGIAILIVVGVALAVIMYFAILVYMIVEAIHNWQEEIDSKLMSIIQWTVAAAMFFGAIGGLMWYFG